jgi:hypothetical protein
MMGTWLERYPQVALAVVLLEGRYIRVTQGVTQGTGGGAVIERGTWKKDGAEYSFSPEGATPTAPTAPPGASPGAMPPWKMTVISLSGRSATVQVGEKVLVLARP